MKNIFYILTLLFAYQATKAAPQFDSTNMGATYSNQVFYSMDNGVISTSNNDNWHIAFSVSGNGAAGSAVWLNDANTIVYNCPFDTSHWNSFDTTGYKSWKRLLNSDTSWTNGAFNTYRGAASTFDMGWGILNPANNYWTFGDSLYLLQINSVFKKFWIVSLKTGVWEFKYANLDGSNEHTTVINKSNYPNKNFVYYSILNDSILNREPNISSWDLTFQKNTDFVANQYVSVSSVFSNKKIWSAKANATDSASAANVQTPLTPLTQNISNLGREWKKFSSATGWVVYDSIAYFLYNYDSTSFYRIVFVGFSGQGSGITYFYKEKLSTITAIHPSKQHDFHSTLYPNPANNSITLLMEYNSDEIAMYSFCNLSGSRVGNGKLNLTSGINQQVIDISNLPIGIYLFNVETQQGSFTQKIIKQ